MEMALGVLVPVFATLNRWRMLLENYRMAPLMKMIFHFAAILLFPIAH
jgi:hypothetical protein